MSDRPILYEYNRDHTNGGSWGQDLALWMDDLVGFNVLVPVEPVGEVALAADPSGALHITALTDVKPGTYYLIEVSDE